ncbi:hypothetical protein M0802_006679 [Mischocyttarus mexicanus]|nr:hypothetical protein M0802_006679 [Mischocyttarus mexicanus]
MLIKVLNNNLNIPQPLRNNQNKNIYLEENLEKIPFSERRKEYQGWFGSTCQKPISGECVKEVAYIEVSTA